MNYAFAAVVLTFVGTSAGTAQPAVGFGPANANTARVTLLPGPTLHSPPGVATSGHSWKSVSLGRGELSLAPRKAGASPARAATQKKPLPKAESLEFKQAIPSVPTELRKPSQ